MKFALPPRFYDHQAFVSAGRILNTDPVIVALERPLAVIFFGLTDALRVEANMVALGHRHVAFVSL